MLILSPCLLHSPPHFPDNEVQFSSVAQLCLTLCDPMHCSTPGFPLLHHLLELAQTHVHRVGDVIEPSHPLSSPSPPAPNPSQHQSLAAAAAAKSLQSCPTLCDSMDCSTPGFPVHHQLPELAQIDVHRVGDAIQPSHHLLSAGSQHEELHAWQRS